MKKKVKREEKKVEVKDSRIAVLVEDYERCMEMRDEEEACDTRVNLSMKIDEVKFAILLHLAELTRETKGGLGASLLEAAIVDAFEHLHRDKSPEEIRDAWLEVTDKYFKETYPEAYAKGKN